MPDRPRRLWRVEYEAAVGWPHPTVRRPTARNYPTAESAGRQVDIIEEMPSHLKLTGVLTTECEWEAVDPASLPRTQREEPDDG